VLAGLLCAWFATPGQAGEVARAPQQETLSIAAAANLVYVLDPLDAAFREFAPGVTVTTAIASSGNLVAQIKNGAPFDVFLSADLDYPRALIAAHCADAASLTPFATGRLVLWTTRPGLPLSSTAAVIRNPAAQKIAIASPRSAPYGRAAEAVLKKLALWAAAQPKLVTGENISQTAQFVATGNADAGFVALSLVLAPKLKERGRWLEIPAGLYAPIAQGAVLTTRGAANPAAVRYLAFLRTPAARKVLERFGYGVPASP
jgi:molybdate transport system substrate-binding protein